MISVVPNTDGKKDNSFKLKDNFPPDRIETPFFLSFTIITSFKSELSFSKTTEIMVSFTKLISIVLSI